MAGFWFFIGIGVSLLICTIRLYLWRKRNRLFRNVFIIAAFSTLMIFIVAALFKLFIL
jgi:hypothetical protein